MHRSIPLNDLLQIYGHLWTGRQPHTVTLAAPAAVLGSTGQWPRSPAAQIFVLRCCDTPVPMPAHNPVHTHDFPPECTMPPLLGPTNRAQAAEARSLPQ
ncbi:hypothetical protein D3C77_555370 [compost metagenome]